MARKRKGQPVHGWIILDKPEDMTSTAAVGAVKRHLDAAKAGHAGTLDPFATGILPIALGEATKTVSYVVDGVKRYLFTIRWGVATDTEDRDGAVTAESDGRPDRAAIEAVLDRFIGEIEQIPPAYSAIKLDGKRAYNLAREGKAPEMPPRMVTINELRLLEMPDTDHAVLEAVCGKGTYIRALARDIALALGTVGHLSALRRTQVGPFDEKSAISLDELRENMHVSAACEYLLPVETALDDIPALAVTDIEAGSLRNGQAVSLLRKADLDRIADLESGDTALAMANGKAVALVRYTAGEIQPVRVLNL
ncbi:MAG: tRNA pseudouridine(55) synthase TruB [Proteobacteria bacterium]|nr:tRNA pseudouridine(55) synthase TruB [Pseudomonadota bacterium]MCK4868313.1 tRNA pseudouridine(55) synthase TruB [Alphaproteobacteria bacterium]